MRTLLLVPLSLLLAACTAVETTSASSEQPREFFIANFVLAPYFLTFLAITLLLWMVIELGAVLLNVLPRERFSTLRHEYFRWRPAAHYGVVILFAVATLGFAIGYIAGNSRESIIGSIVTTAMTALGGAAAYWFSRKGESKRLSAIAVALFTITLVYGTQVGARWRVEYEMWKMGYDAQIEAVKAKTTAEIETQKLMNQSEVTKSVSYYEMQLTVEEYRVKKLMDIEAKSLPTTENTSFEAPASSRQAMNTAFTRPVEDLDPTACVLLCSSYVIPPPTGTYTIEIPDYGWGPGLPPVLPARIPYVPPILPPIIPEESWTSPWIEQGLEESIAP